LTVIARALKDASFRVYKRQEETMTRVFRVCLLVAGLLAGYAGSAYAQGTGSIFGKVSDSSGGVLPGVIVTVTGTGLQQPLVATTSESGSYQFPTVPIGTYAVTFELASFKKAQRVNIIISSNKWQMQTALTVQTNPSTSRPARRRSSIRRGCSSAPARAPFHAGT
jgi:Carboxypeptidase regulatory-like domain